MNNEELVRLEQLVDTLIESYSELKKKYRALKENLQESEDERELLKMELTELQEMPQGEGESQQVLDSAPL